VCLVVVRQWGWDTAHVSVYAVHKPFLAPAPARSHVTIMYARDNPVGNLHLFAGEPLSVCVATRYRGESDLSGLLQKTKRPSCLGNALAALANSPRNIRI